jgi:acetyl-CoA C-acetyltransferase
VSAGLTADLRRPVVVGAGQLRANRERTVEGAREPLVLLTAALRQAERDAGVPGLLAAADAVWAVNVASWAYDDLAAKVGAAVGAIPRTCVDTGLGGHHPVRLLDEAAARIWSGESEISLLVGAEAQASVSLLGKAGIDPVTALGWSAGPGGPPAFDPDQLGSPAMQAAGLLAPTRVYPLYENRLQADLGLTPEESHAWSAQLYAAMSRAAAGHPASWSDEALTEEQIALAGPGNRMVCEPYPLSMNAMPHVDQAAALVVTSLGTARASGVPDDALVHVWGGAGADDEPDLLARKDFGHSRALGDALDRCLAAGGAQLRDLDLVDVYSCFPVVPKLVALHLGLPPDAAMSVTGGHSAFGGPLNSYSLHALATVAQRLRGEGGTGLVHANGGYLTHQHAVLLSSRPHPDGYVGDPEPRQVRDEPVRTALPAEAAGTTGSVDVVVETATVEHGRNGAAVQAFVVGRTGDGARVAGATPRGDEQAARVLSLAQLPPGATTHVGRRLRLHLLDDGTATAEPHDPDSQEQP